MGSYLGKRRHSDLLIRRCAFGSAAWSFKRSLSTSELRCHASTAASPMVDTKKFRCLCQEVHVLLRLKINFVVENFGEVMGDEAKANLVLGFVVLWRKNDFFFSFDFFVLAIFVLVIRWRNYRVSIVVESSFFWNLFNERRNLHFLARGGIIKKFFLWLLFFGIIKLDNVFMLSFLH